MVISRIINALDNGAELKIEVFEPSTMELYDNLEIFKTNKIYVVRKNNVEIIATSEAERISKFFQVIRDININTLLFNYVWKYWKEEF